MPRQSWQEQPLIWRFLGTRSLTAAIPKAPYREMPRCRASKTSGLLLEFWYACITGLALLSHRPLLLIIQPHHPAHLIFSYSADFPLVHLCSAAFLIQDVDAGISQDCWL